MVLSRQVPPQEKTALANSRFLKHSRSADDGEVSEQFKEFYDVTTTPLPKFHINEDGISSELAATLVRHHLSLDGNASLNFASFVHTGIDPAGLELCIENITKNLADSDEYPAMLELHQRCISILSHLWHVPQGELGVGTATTGSSEAVMLGGLAMKRRWEAQRKAQGKSTEKPNIIMGANAQVALEKFARYFDVEMRLLDVHAKDHFSFSMEDLRKNIDENTIGVFAILGSTFTGHYQDVEAINAVLDEHEKETGNDISIHIDGASGAFVAPFLTPDLKWDFQIPRVRSINCSGHKFGLAPVGCGWIVWRDLKYLPENLRFTLNYLGGTEETFTLNFSRPGHPVIYQYYMLVRNGFKGYRTTHLVSMSNARLLSLFLESTTYFDVLSDIHRPKGVYFTKSGKPTYTEAEIDAVAEHPLDYFNPGLPVVSFKFTDAFKRDYPFVPQEAVAFMLRDHGYIIPNYPLPPAEDKNECLRVVINENMSVDLLDKLMEDIVRVTNRLMSIAKEIPSGDQKVALQVIATLAKVDHSEEDNEKKWKKAQGNFSRC